jgi:hypothetical protein
MQTALRQCHVNRSEPNWIHARWQQYTTLIIWTRI